MDMNPKKDSHHLQAEKRAAEWLSRRDGTEWSAEAQAALDQWLEESPAHAVAFIRLQAAWNSANRFKALGAGFPPRQVPAPEKIQASPFFDERTPTRSRLQALINEEPEGKARPGRARLPWALAASIVAVLTAALVWQLSHTETSYRTPVGGNASIPMEDGSRVTLNTDSEVRLAVTDTERNVHLERGEAYFEVARDPDRPFVVDAGRQRIVAVGTAFSVRRDGEDVRVVVTDGRVRIEEGEGGSAPDTGPASAGDKPQTFLLEAGAVARADGAGVLVQEKSLAEVQEALSWRSGMVVFRNVDLAEAVAEFNRYNERKIRIEDPEIAGIRLSGKFRPGNFNSFVHLLEDGFPIEVQQRSDGIVLSRR